MDGGKLSRRELLKYSAAAAAIGAVAPGMLFGEEEAEPEEPDPRLRLLGKTRLKVTAVSIGCMTAPEPVIAKALEMGINWFDTAHSYKGGRNELEVGRVLAGKRDKVHICTKLPKGSTAAMLSKLDASLKRLGTDHVDLLLTHGAGGRGDVLNEACLAALERAKKAGKARFIGVSTHSKMAEVIDAVVRSKRYDAVVTAYNFTAPKGLREAIARAKKAGVGIIAMKTQHGNFTDPTGELTPHQAMLKWVLDDENVTCAIPGMRTFQQVEENVAVMGEHLTYFDRRKLRHYAEVTAGMYCTGCGECDGACPAGVDAAAVRRCGMYADGYRDVTLARESYRQIASNAAACVDCAECSARCVRGMPLGPVLRDIHRRLA